MNIKNKTILLTGATGYLSSLLIPELLKYNPKKIYLYARNEYKLYSLLQQYNNNILEDCIGDIRDRERLFSRISKSDIVIHTAALKRLDLVNENPQEAIKTNVMGSVNILDGCLNYSNVKKLVFISTDKAIHPTNLYGMTKGTVERMIIERSRKESNCIYTIARYGNVISSTGAFIPRLIEHVKTNRNILLTDKDMTRFLITKNMALDVVNRALEETLQSKVIIPIDLISVEILDVILWLIEFYKSKSRINIVGKFSGEKLHEEIIPGYFSNNKDFLIDKHIFLDILKEEGLLND